MMPCWWAALYPFTGRVWDNRLLAQAIGTANACGAMVVTAKGAMTALPYPEQLAAFRASHPLEKSC